MRTQVWLWASESVKISYRDPLTGSMTIYVLISIQYTDRKGKQRVELIEAKSENPNEARIVGRDKFRQAQYVRNI